MSILTLSGASQETLLARDAVAKNYIVPAATFTNAAASSADGGAKTTLTSAGAHGLTAAVAAGKNLNITAGTGWDTGFYNISSIDSDTSGVAITIDVPYDAGMGVPTIALANTSTVFATITIPALMANSHIEIDASWSIPSNGNNKLPEIKWGGTTWYGPGLTAALLARPSSLIIQNRGATNSQVSAFVSTNAAQNNTAATAITTATIDTSIATALTIGGRCATANDYIILERYIVKYYL